MASRALISVAEYLRTSYRPDCDYVDGEVEERNLGELDHSSVQKRLILFFGNREQEWKIYVFPEQRVQVSSSRYRVPDVCVLVKKPIAQILTEPPFLCVEVLSPEDRLSRLEDRVDDYLKMGVSYVWVLDPQTKRAWSITPVEGWREEKSGILKTENPALEVPLAEIFA